MSTRNLFHKQTQLRCKILTMLRGVSRETQRIVLERGLAKYMVGSASNPSCACPECEEAYRGYKWQATRQI